MSVNAPVIAIIGGSSVSKKFYEIARAAGALVAKRGAVLVCGGLSGVMEACCRGAKENGGMTVGILPGKRKSEANDYVDIAVPTGMNEARNAVIVNMADAIIAVDGKEGTLSEIAFALKQKKPVAGIETFEIEGVMKAVDPAEAVDLVWKKINGDK